MEKLNKEQLIKLVKKIINVEGKEDEIDEMINLLENNVPHPEVSGLIFWNEENYTPEQIVEIALSYKPIQL
ncbi:bacteriocin immunity protein [Oceanirhabdus sp. W0125-5]|uniref:bacteriocin immunity protein n=1 Tax=Oceanirhabdus sp. W0125-5 TaxID=2999116 RepID=UPI0022F30CF1|nr:bacteriocin immunity protein [Oceanirhabdus sp. W0125-5]WBW96084.1 bacteriocin immunity protein [Oceanirhabdus sp. W0125-5]